MKRVIACDPNVDAVAFAERGVPRVSKGELLEQADIIVNHMCLSDDNVHYFDEAAFDAMVRRPIFINLGRGLCVDEEALVAALDAGKLRAFGTDVLYDETPDLATNKLVGRDNVIITPHSAFYSTTAIEDLERLSCENIVHFLKGEKERVFKLVNEV